MVDLAGAAQRLDGADDLEGAAFAEAVAEAFAVVWPGVGVRVGREGADGALDVSVADGSPLSEEQVAAGRVLASLAGALDRARGPRRALRALREDVRTCAHELRNRVNDLHLQLLLVEQAATAGRLDPETLAERIGRATDAVRAVAAGLARMEDAGEAGLSPSRRGAPADPPA
ncbi:MAG: hypothetical protein ACOZNI_33915 [Myxococcota bacterium]